jgi:hypothetical protein
VVAKQRAELEAKLDVMIKEKSADITAKLKDVEGKLSPQLAEVDRRIQEKISQASGVNLSSSDGGASVIDEQLNKMGVPPQFKEMFKKLMQNKPELLMKIAQETEAAMKGGMSQIAAAQSVMMKYQKDLRDAMK